MSKYEQELIDECEQHAAQLVRNLQTTKELLTKDNEVVDETAKKQVDVKVLVEQESRELKSALDNVLRGNKYRKFMLMYIVIAYIVVSQVCRFF